MANASLPGILQHLRLAVAPRNSAGVSDALLLERFARHRDESAFELLVWRHGKMVLGTCRRLLRDAHDAEDAFQACFLALARRAGSIGKGESVGGWLHKVAYRLALGVKARRAKRDAREQTMPDFSLPGRSPDPVSEAARREERRALDDEVARLPDKFRVPFVLCYFEGWSNADVARELGCPVGTVESRLTRARQRLCAGLTRRGVTAPAGVLAALLAGESAFVPAALAASTAKAAAGAATGKVLAGGLISTHVAVLTEGVLRDMFITKLKTAAAIVLTAAMLTGTGAGALTYHTQPGEEAPAKATRAPADKAPAKADEASIARLIDQLGSDSFAEREKAMKELNEIGGPALAALRKAADDSDAERKKRVRDLLQKIEARVQSARVLAPARVHLVYKDTPLVDAVADFKKKSGYDIALADPEGKLKGRTVTLDTGEVTFWRALGLFCEKAGLVETSAQANAGMMMPGMGGGFGGGAAGMPGMGGRFGGALGGGAGGAGGAPAMPAGAPGPGGAAPAAAPGAGGGAGVPAVVPPAPMLVVPGRFIGGGMAPAAMAGSSVATPSRILLADGKPKALPTDDRTAIRVRALEKGSPPGGNFAVTLEVTPEPKVRVHQVVSVHVNKAKDDQGQQLEQLLPEAGVPMAGMPAAPPAVRFIGMAGAGGMPGPGAGGMGGMGGWGNLERVMRPHLLAVRLKKSAKPAKKLEELSGSVSIRVFEEPRTLVTMADILESAGKAVKGADGGSIAVLNLNSQPGRTILRVKVELPGGAPFQVSTIGDRLVLTDGAAASAQHELTLADKDGKLLSPRGVSVNGTELLLTYVSQKDQEPAKLALTASKVIPVEVPFSLKDVPLP